MGAETERRRTSASPAAAAAGEWVPLRRHPVFSSAASSPTEHPTNLLAWDSSASRLYLWDAPKSALHRLSLRFGDDPHDPDSIEAAAASKILFPDVRLQISVLNVAVNRAGTCVAICGANGLYVMYLYNRTAAKDDGSATCRTVCVGSQLYVGEQNFVHILQASWHSHSDTHLGVLSSDSVFRLFDLSSDMDKAEQEFYLQPGERGRCHDAVSICPVAFSIGEHLWERFSVFILFSDGSIYILCPVVPFGSFYSAAAVDELYKDAHNLGLKSSNPQAVNNSSLAISWLETAFPEVADQARESSKSLALRARSQMSLHACLLLQGPLRRVSHIGESEESTHEVECKGRAVSFLLKSISKDSDIVIAWSSGQLQIDALADEIVPLWDASTSPRAREPVLQDNPSTTFDPQASQNLDTVWLGIPPSLLPLAIVDLALPTSGITAGSFLMFSDPLFSEKMYCLHVGGVDLLSLHFLPFSSQSSGKDEYANAPFVVPVLTTGSDDDSCPQFPLYGFVAVESSYGNSWIIGVTSSHKCIVLETRGWEFDGIQKPASAFEEVETETPNIISKELLLGPTSVFAPQGLSVVNPDSIEGHSILHHYFKLFCENYVAYAHKVYLELKDHADHMKEIITDQHKRWNDAEHMLLQAEQKQSTLDERMKRVFQFHKKLEERLQIFQDLPGAKKKPLSKAERELKHLLGSKLPSLLMKLGGRDNMQARKTKIKDNLPSSSTGMANPHAPIDEYRPDDPSLGVQMVDSQIPHGPTFDHNSGHGQSLSQEEHSFSGSESSLASKQVLNADIPHMISGCSNDHDSVEELAKESGVPFIIASPKTLPNVLLSDTLGSDETFEEIVYYEDSDKEGNACEVEALSHADDLISSSHQGTFALPAAGDPPNALLHNLRAPTLIMMEKSLSMLQTSSLLDFPEIRTGLQTLLTWASGTGLCFPKMESVLIELSDLHSSTLSTEIPRLTCVKDELEKVLHQESLNIESLLKNHDEREERLRLLDQEINNLQTQRATIQEELTLQESALIASKEGMKHKQESLLRISSELHSSTILAAQAEAQYKKMIASITLDEQH